MTTLSATGPLQVQDSIPESSPGAWYGLAVITVVLLFGLVDRQIFILLAEQIKHDLALSDLQLGLLQGLGLALFGALVSFPIGWLADRMDRRIVMSLCIAVWSLAVAACGLASNFTALLIASAIVGAGEAGLSPLTIAMIPDLFRGNRRQTANSVFTIASQFGGGIAIALCGYLIVAAGWLRPLMPAAWQGFADWRLAFFLAAAPAPLFILLMLSVRLPRLPRSIPPVPTQTAAPTEGEGLIGLGQFVRDHWQATLTFNIGMYFATFAFAANVAWIPVIAMRQFGASPTEAGSAVGLCYMVAVGFGMIVSLGGARPLRRWLGPATPIIMVAFSAISGGLVIMLGLFATSATQLFVIYGAHVSCVMCGQMFFPTAIQNLGPAHLRGRLVAIVRIGTSVTGALSPALVGVLSDGLPKSPGSLLAITLTVAMSGLVICGVALLYCARHYPRTAAYSLAVDDAIFVASRTAEVK